MKHRRTDKKKRHTTVVKKEKYTGVAQSAEEGEDEEDDGVPREHPITHLKRIKLLNGKDKESIKSVKLREPNDIQHEKPRSLKKRTAGDALQKKSAPPPLGPLVVMPRRENQNEYVLSPFVRRQGEFPLQRDIEATTVTALSQQQQQRKNEFPIEDLLSNGFMPFYHNNIPGVLGTVSAEFYRNAMLIEHENASNQQQQQQQQQQEEEERAEEDGPNKRQKTTDQLPPDPSLANIVTPLNQTIAASQFNWDVANYGPNNTTGKAELYEKVNQFYANFRQRMKQFFIDDQLTRETRAERIAATTHGRLVKHRPPRSYAIFRDMEAKMGARYRERLNIMQESGSRIPKFRDEPPIPKHWFEEYRLRPLPTDQLCSKRCACRFNTHSKKESTRYIARRFVSPAEARDGYVRNTEGLCIDCLLYSWTKRTFKQVGCEKAPLVQINYFTVLCEPGQYNRECMLPQQLNGRPTGIVGCVPAYTTGKRISVPIKLQRIDGDCLVEISTNYLAETGTDF